MEHDMPNVSNVQGLLKTRELGRTMVFEACIDSTNRLAKVLAADGRPHGTTIVADSQTAGRGRLDHRWSSPAGKNLYVSILLKPKASSESFPQIPLLCALALRRTLAELAPQMPMGIKWPNDLQTRETRRKLSGILCEGVFFNQGEHGVVAGIGINVNATESDFPVELRTYATSMKMETGTFFSRSLVLAEFLGHFEKVLDAWEASNPPSLEQFSSEWRDADLLYGRQIAIDQDGRHQEGRAVGIDAKGHLLLEDASGSISIIHAGDAHIVRR